MLEADAVERVAKLDIDAQVIGIELQPVAGKEPALFRDIQGQGGDRAVASEAPVAIARRISVEGDHMRFTADFSKNGSYSHQRSSAATQSRAYRVGQRIHAEPEPSAAAVYN